MDAAIKDTSPSNGLGKRLPTTEEVDSAAHAATAIAIAIERDGALQVAGIENATVRIAPAVGELIVELLGHVASGNMVTLVPTGTMLTTQDAADMLNVSRPFLTKLLKTGEIPFEEVGKHRRVRLEDLMEYRDRRHRQREDALDELARLGQEYDAG